MFIPPVSGESHTPGFFVFGSAFVSDRWSVFFDGNGRFHAQEGIEGFDAQPVLDSLVWNGRLSGSTRIWNET